MKSSACRGLTALVAVVWMAVSARGADLLLEAEGFDFSGGWSVDAQFVEQMGSPYLIAHGLGVPVADASTRVTLAEAGDYRVWVRTRNWVPAYSHSAAPGRFSVLVNGAALATEFGADADGAWHWQDGGTVSLTGTAATVALHDLTGFDGRCDAIALVTGAAPPPPQGAALAEWRRGVLGEPVLPAVTQSFDCVIVGGGMAGCCAALAAGRSGLSVALVQDRPVLGGNASEEIRVATRGEIRNSIVNEIDTFDLSNRDDATAARDALRLTKIEAETNITLFLEWRAYGAGTNANGRVAYVDARHTHLGDRCRLTAPIFIDCTGDAWIGYWAGADYRMGREAADEFGESRAPATADAKTMGNSLMWKSRVGAAPSVFPTVPWAMDVAGTRAETGGEWNWEYGMSLNTIDDAEQIRDHLLRAIFGNFYNAKQNAANANRVLDWVPYVAGKRESRRLMGDHLLIQSDVVNGVYFEDAVGTATWGIDLHYETSVSYLSTFTATHVARWYFPFRCLYSRNVPNLMMAGRCISVSHVGLGSPRVQNTTGQMGVAVGYAAAICKEYGIEPRDIYRDVDRTVELQARITGTWPARPANGTIVDNSDAPPHALAVGTWTASTSEPGYYGANYQHDGNTAKGAKRVAYTPELAPGEYDISMRWTPAANRASNTPVWIRTNVVAATLPATGLGYMRVGSPDTAYGGGGEALVGRAPSSDYHRGLLSFDLSTVPADALVVSAELRLTIGVPDAASVDGFVGDEGLRVYCVTQAFSSAEATWNSRATGTAWATAGGAFEPTPVATIVDPTDPKLVGAGEIFAFPPSGELAAAAAAAHAAGHPLGLIVRTPTLEKVYASRKMYRFSAAALTVRYVTVALPADLTVDQSDTAMRDQWVPLGRYSVSSNGVTVVIGNDGTTQYVIADAVQFVEPGASSNDRDGDGLPDAWERYYFLSETGAKPDDDPDGDRRSNFVECMTGTDPTDPGSRYDMRVWMAAAAKPIELRWPSASNLTYRIECATNLPTFATLIGGIAATPPTNVYAIAPIDGTHFYRVVAE